MTNRTTATLEWAAQVSAAARMTSSMGWVDTAPRNVRRLAKFSYGRSRSTNWCKAISTRPSPISTRPKSRGPAEARRNINTPIKISAGATSATSSDNTCTMSVVPTLAPSMTARAGTRSTRPLAAKPVTIRPVAVLLCNRAVTPIPAKKALKRFRSALPRKLRSFAPKARCTPVWTIWTPHRRSATDPARSIRVRGKPISPAPFKSGIDLLGREAGSRSGRRSSREAGVSSVHREHQRASEHRRQQRDDGVLNENGDEASPQLLPVIG